MFAERLSSQCLYQCLASVFIRISENSVQLAETAWSDLLWHFSGSRCFSKSLLLKNHAFSRAKCTKVREQSAEHSEHRSDFFHNVRSDITFPWAKTDRKNLFSPWSYRYQQVGVYMCTPRRERVKAGVWIGTELIFARKRFESLSYDVPRLFQPKFAKFHRQIFFSVFQ